MAFSIARLARFGAVGIALSVVATVAQKSAAELERNKKAPRSRKVLRTVSRVAGRR